MRLRINILFLFVAMSCSGATITHNPAWWSASHPSLLDGLVSYWKLDEASGTRFDSWGTNHLTDVNSVASTDGKLDICATNNGVPAKYLDSSSQEILSLTNFSVNCWYYPQSTIAASQFLNRDTQSGQGRCWAMAYTATGPGFAVAINTNNAGGVALLRSVSPIGRWHMVSIVKSNRLFSLWTNGVLCSSTNLTADFVNTNTVKFTIGNIQNGSPSFPMIGKIDEPSIYNRALTSSELLTLFNESKARRFPFNSGP